MKQKISISTKNIFLLSLLLIIITTSCKKKIDLELEDTYVRLAVEGLVTNETKRHTVFITETSNYFANEPQPKVLGAIVTIDDGISQVTLTETSPGVYQTDSTYAGVPGRTYTLNVKYKSEEYSANCLLKPVAPIDSISFAKDAFEPNKSSINLWAMEPATTGDYYLWLYYINGKLESDTLKEISFASDEMVNGNYMPGFPIFTAEFALGDTITLEMQSINKDYYDFLNAFFTEVFGAGNPFSGPPANVKGNIVNLTHKDKDVMGYFLAGSVTRKTQIVTKID